MLRVSARASTEPLDDLARFRRALYAAFGRRRDALFDLVDALLTAAPAPSLVHLCLAPAHRRGWGSLYAALRRGQTLTSTANTGGPGNRGWARSRARTASAST